MRKMRKLGKKWQNLYGNIYLPKKHQICLEQKDFFFFFFLKEDENNRQQKYDKFGIFVGGSCSAKGSLPMCHLDCLA